MRLSGHWRQIVFTCLIILVAPSVDNIINRVRYLARGLAVATYFLIISVLLCLLRPVETNESNRRDHDQAKDAGARDRDSIDRGVTLEETRE
jgi:hypothetical protein